MDNLTEIVNRLRKTCDLGSDKELAQKLGLSQPDFSVRKKRGTLLPLIIDYAINEQVNLDWLLKGEQYAKVEEVKKEGITVESCLDTEQYGMVPLLESWVTGGPDGEILYEGIADYYPFKKWWLDHLVGKSEQRQKHLILVRVRGDSMSPTINPGEVALVDTWEAERLEIRTGRIYLVVLPDGPVAMKRLVLSREQERITLACLSDNTPAYRPFDFTLDPDKCLKDYVLGRVRWAGKEFD